MDWTQPGPSRPARTEDEPEIDSGLCEVCGQCTDLEELGQEEATGWAASWVSLERSDLGSTLEAGKSEARLEQGWLARSICALLHMW